MRILQWNCRSIFAQYSELCSLLEEKRVDVACLSETCLDQNSHISFNNFHLVHKARNRQGGGSGILIRRNLAFSVITDDLIIRACSRVNIDLTLVEIFTDSRSLFIASIYNPPGGASRKPPDFWRNFLLDCSRRGDIVVCGDFNAHSPMWSVDCESADAEVSRLEMALSMNDLVCINDGSATWSSVGDSVRSAIDLTIASSALTAVSLWRVDSYKHGSDQFPIFITLNDFQIKKTPCRPTFSTHKMDWDLFRSIFDSDLDTEGISSKSVTEAYDHLTETIKNSIIRAGGRVKTYNQPSDRPAVV